ncbi:hypothetical protein [Methylotenera sp.]|uniref:hypothetical protein n=1 Tax=Methylotenera sp. TaxID=2051956 RepID=UPI002733C9E6|nr:hypothetical protein [Methylotenera sp.]MDP3210949.1 hypothetical protein [Methylotenera sp.]
MRVNLPALWAINEKIHIGFIKQLLSPEKIIICNVIQFTREKDVGLLLEDEQGNVVSYVFSKTPKAIYTRDESVIVCRSRPQDDFLDLKSGEWVANPLLNSNNTNLFARNALDSWSNAFRFVEENQTQNIIGFRKPQLGADLPPVTLPVFIEKSPFKNHVTCLSFCAYIAGGIRPQLL